MIKINICKLIISFFLCAVIFLYCGYILRGVHYRQDLPRVEKIQAELRTDVHEIKRDFMPIIESAIKALQAHPAIPFVEPEEEE